MTKFRGQIEAQDRRALRAEPVNLMVFVEAQVRGARNVASDVSRSILFLSFQKDIVRP